MDGREGETGVKTITIDPVTRIEGHARVLLDVDDGGALKNATLVVNELRGFERILVGMEADRMPLVTARICGVCPTAHHLAAVKAIENALGVEPPPAAKRLRELLLLGHMIHSHTLSLFILTGPDLFFGLVGDSAKRNIIGIIQADPDVARKALRLRTLGQKVNEIVGGRGTHPVTAVLGGMTFEMGGDGEKLLHKIVDEMYVLVMELAPVIKRQLEKFAAAQPAVPLVLTDPTWYMGTVKNGKLNFYDGAIRIINEAGEIQTEFSPAAYDKQIVEKALSWSYMKPVYALHGGRENIYRVGTLARINCADALETPLAQNELEDFRKKFGRMCHATVQYISARLIELIYCVEQAKALMANPEIRGATRVPVTYRAGRGVGHVEAPRGTLYHDYEIDEKGIVRSANLLVATQQNYAAINTSIAQMAGLFIKGVNHDMLLNGVEFPIRCYDPCLSCATHAIGNMPLSVEVLRDGVVTHRIRRTK
jgi:F420-non-reducing hydrogenase large subunit